MRVEEIDRLVALAAHFGIEVYPARRNAAMLEDGEHALGGEINVGWELVGVPAEEQITGVGVDGAEEALAAGVVELVLHGVAGQRGVVGLNVELHVIFQTVGADEVQARGGIKVVLVLGRLLRLGLEEELAGEADLFRVIHGHVHELGEVIKLALHIGVEPALVAFAAAPENVVFTTQFLGNLEHLFHLTGGVGKDIGVAAGCGAVHETRVAEEIGGAPEQLDARAFLLLLENAHDSVEVVVALLQRGAFGRDVAIVKTVKGRAQFFEELNEHPRAVLGILYIVRARFPRAHCCAWAEWIIAHSAHGVPIGDAEAQVVLHGLALDYLVGVIMLEGQWIFGIRALVFNCLNVREKFSHGINRVRAHWRQAARASQGKGGK